MEMGVVILKHHRWSSVRGNKTLGPGCGQLWWASGPEGRGQGRALGKEL